MSQLPRWARAGRSHWRYCGQERPPFALQPGPGQESVWDYPRPPRLQVDRRPVTVRTGGVVIAQSSRAVRVMETASPPTFYLPPQDVRTTLLEPASGSSLCEWKGEARYWSVVLPGQLFQAVAWSYPNPFPDFASIAGFFSFYPARLECYLGSERVSPQPGQFYGGWVTPELVGPFKGEPDSGSW